ncbi:hypothetical protein E2C01_054271 [Portunus trituberculatus]|uniref:Uncharacterized protein n=1 Tax=Portunus trituberculatus TaxID=210409 RepID=A0A5B7GN07_PORTR|nr:hypothetical protein [Portunus trituberculatus]
MRFLLVDSSSYYERRRGSSRYVFFTDMESLPVYTIPSRVRGGLQGATRSTHCTDHPARPCNSGHGADRGGMELNCCGSL